ncbi:MAG: hypothetical protein H6624_16400 [Bdellovibrionaceae bacterium]|nr:hypothetical protein [Bdellovibrionales bacterium]MCB9085928.1 hypothetical protein [Pseudobdellovibrionaceae bacterium]
MKALILVMSILAGLSVAQANIDCSNADQSIQYEMVGYNRGIPPRHGDTLSTERIFLDGTLISENIQYEGLNPQRGPVVAEFDYNSKVELENSSSRMGFRQVYVIKLTLSNRDYSTGLVGDDAGTLAADITDYVLCRDIFLAVP